LEEERFWARPTSTKVGTLNGNTGSRQIGPLQIGPRQIGPLADLAANWAPHFLGPNLPFFGKLGPGKLGPLAANWAPANWAPADWAPWRQIGPRQIGPR